MAKSAPRAWSGISRARIRRWRRSDAGRAHCLFLGAHGDVWPAWFRDRTQAPRWNAEVAQFTVDIALLDAPADTEACSEALVMRMEGRTPGGGRSDERGARRGISMKAAIGFRARIVETRCKFRLGQNERDDVLADALAGLDAGGRDAPASAMRRANAGRLEAAA